MKKVLMMVFFVSALGHAQYGKLIELPIGDVTKQPKNARWVKQVFPPPSEIPYIYNLVFNNKSDTLKTLDYGGGNRLFSVRGGNVMDTGEDDKQNISIDGLLPKNGLIAEINGRTSSRDSTVWGFITVFVRGDYSSSDSFSTSGFDPFPDSFKLKIRIEYKGADGIWKLAKQTQTTLESSVFMTGQAKVTVPNNVGVRFQAFIPYDKENSYRSGKKEVLDARYFSVSHAKLFGAMCFPDFSNEGKCLDDE